MLPKKTIGLSLVLFLLLVFVSISGADTIYFSDGSQLKCKILDTVVDASSGLITYKVQVEGGIVKFYDRQRVKDSKEDDSFEPVEIPDYEIQLKNWIRSATDVADATSPMHYAVLKPHSSLEAVVTSLKGWGYLLLSSGEEGLEVEPQQSIQPGQTIATAKNSRLSFKINDEIMFWLEADSRLQFHQCVYERDVGLYDTVLDLQKGGMWVNIDFPPEKANRVKLNCSGVTFITTKNLLHFYRDDNKNIHTTVFSGDDLNIQYGIGDERMNLSASQELQINNMGNMEILAKIEDKKVIEDWKNWNKWNPVFIDVEPELVSPDIPQAPVEKIIPALGEKEGVLLTKESGHRVNLGLVDALKMYRKALQNYYRDVGAYPSTEQGLKVLMNGDGIPNWKGPYIGEFVLDTDPWGTPFIYKNIQQSEKITILDIHSAGPNRIDENGFGDDLR